MRSSALHSTSGADRDHRAHRPDSMTSTAEQRRNAVDGAEHVGHHRIDGQYQSERERELTYKRHICLRGKAVSDNRSNESLIALTTAYDGCFGVYFDGQLVST